MKMYEYLIGEYVNNKLTEQDINSFALNKNIHLTQDEIKIIYVYIKNYWKEFYKGNPAELFIELKEKLNKKTYDTIIKLYEEYKNKI